MSEKPNRAKNLILCNPAQIFLLLLGFVVTVVIAVDVVFAVNGGVILSLLLLMILLLLIFFLFIEYTTQIRVVYGVSVNRYKSCYTFL